MESIYDKQRKQHDRNEDTLHLNTLPTYSRSWPPSGHKWSTYFLFIYLFIKVEPFYLKQKKKEILVNWYIYKYI